MKIHVIGDVIAKGKGIGRNTAYGAVVIANTSKELFEKMVDNAVVVTIGTDKVMIPYLKNASAIVTKTVA
jgi:pyruvate kinase